MSTDVETTRHRSRLLKRAHRLLDVPALFDLNQVIIDGGKRTPVERFLDGIRREAVLDLGCGTGAWSYLATDRYLGIDYSPSFVDGCRRRFAHDDRKSFAVGDVESLELDDRFDMALLMSVLHHLSDQQSQALLARLTNHADAVLVMDLIPIAGNPLSQLLYRLDRGDFIRSVDDQRRLLTASGKWRVDREDDFHSYNRLYRHSLFLLRPQD